MLRDDHPSHASTKLELELELILGAIACVLEMSGMCFQSQHGCVCHLCTVACVRGKPEENDSGL